MIRCHWENEWPGVAGGAADNLILNGVNTLVLPIYNIGFGLDAILVGGAQSIPRFIDAFTDPVIGHISDNTRSRWGRRTPYIFIGAILAAISLGSLASVDGAGVSPAAASSDPAHRNP